MNKHANKRKKHRSQQNEEYLKTHNLTEQTSAEEIVRAEQADPKSIAELQNETVKNAQIEKN